jgi:hypothetical protein
MTTDGGGWIKVVDYNGTIPLTNRLSIDHTDWVQNNQNYSRLYSMAGMKTQSGVYEFKLENFKGNTKLWLQFTQTNAYNENPIGNSFTRK